MVFSTVLAEETAAQAEDLSNVFVVLMGMGTVFVGLICLVILCLLTSFIIRKFVASRRMKPRFRLRQRRFPKARLQTGRNLLQLFPPQLRRSSEQA